MQSSLVFVLGFLSAAFIAFAVAPMVWRRAVALTRRRIEASTPLTQAEIQADKDRMRAEFAMATRRLEINFKTFREKAAAQIVEINRNREELKQLMAERDQRHQALTRLEAESGEIRAELRRREDELQILTERLEQAEHLLHRRGDEVQKLGRMYDEASFAASSRQVEIAARESEVEKLNNDMMTLRSERRDIDRRNQELAAETQGARETLKTEQARAAALEARVERLLATVADRDERLDRSERELARVREALKAGTESEGGLQAGLAALEEDNAALRSENARLSDELQTFVSGAKTKEAERQIAKLSADRDVLEERLKLLVQENRKLKVDVAVHQRTKSEDWSGERRQSARLREQMSDLAAEVVRLTAALEGPDSPIEKALEASAAGHDGSGRKALSLADKVRQLQKAAASG
jgi:chromosome segregation ATPase